MLLAAAAAPAAAAAAAAAAVATYAEAVVIGILEHLQDAIEHRLENQNRTPSVGYIIYARQEDTAAEENQEMLITLMLLSLLLHTTAEIWH